MSKVTQAIIDIAKSETIDSGKVRESFEFLLKTASLAISVDRVSIWFLSDDRQQLKCELLYQNSQKSYSNGVVLNASDFPSYFKFFDQDLILAADDAHTHENTHEFSEAYLTPLGINSMMDVSIKENSRLVGVVCFEHVGEKRVWTDEDQSFACIVSEFVSKVFRMEQLNSSRSKVAHTDRLNTIGEMAAGIAHEIMTPITVIHGHANKLKRSLGETNDEKSVESVLRIKDSLKRMVSIIDGLKKISHLKQDEGQETTKVAPIFQDALNLCENWIKYTDLNVIIENESDNLINCNTIEITQVIINLLNNARDELEKLDNIPKQWIKLIAIDEEDQIHIKVKDSGSGIPDELLPNIFDPFFTTKPKGKGTGLGLSICKNIILEHQGKFYYDKEDGESTFHIILG